MTLCIKLVVFDLDDTLYLERDFVAGGFTAVAEFLARTAGGSADELARRMHELQRSARRDIFQTVLADLGQSVDPDRVRRLVDLYRTADRPLVLAEDADRALARVRSLGLSSAILTDGPPEGQRTKVKLLKLPERVDHIIYTAEHGHDAAKPGTKGFADLANRFAADASQCVYIADNERKDFLGPNRLGWQTAKITRPGSLYSDYRAPEPAYRPKLTAATLDELEFRRAEDDQTGLKTVRDRLIEAMKTTFGEDQKRITHALDVLAHAEAILAVEPGSAIVVVAAAVLHDIGIHEAERKQGSSAGRYQELEGPPIARAITERIGLDHETIDHVCRIVASHHSAKDIDTPEFRIIWDADWLVNIPDEMPGASRDKIKGLIEKVFKTETGKKRAYRFFAGD